MKRSTWMLWSAALVMSIVACTTDDGAGGGGGDDEPPEEDCGDNKCTGDEDRSSCPEDCGTCGDTKCEGTENATTCPADCSGTTAVCNNNVCETGETTSCPGDCPATLRTVNQSSYTVYSLYVARCEATEWGPDQTNAGVINAGSSFTLTNVPPGCWDMRAEGYNGTPYWQRFGVQITALGTFTWTLTN